MNNKLNMLLTQKKQYAKLSDKEIVMRIITKPHDENAAAYLLFDRYHPLFLSQFAKVIGCEDWLEDCMQEFFFLIRGPQNDWYPLASFQWRSTLGCYLKRISMNFMTKFKNKMIDKHGYPVSLDMEPPDRPMLQIPADEGETYEQIDRKIMLMEAIAKLKDKDDQFIIHKTLEGYKSKEIAIMLQRLWDKEGVVRTYKGKTVVASEAYVNVTRNRAYGVLRNLLEEAFRCSR